MNCDVIPTMESSCCWAQFFATSLIRSINSDLNRRMSCLKKFLLIIFIFKLQLHLKSPHFGMLKRTEMAKSLLEHRHLVISRLLISENSAYIKRKTLPLGSQVVNRKQANKKSSLIQVAIIVWYCFSSLSPLPTNLFKSWTESVRYWTIKGRII